MSSLCFLRCLVFVKVDAQSVKNQMGMCDEKHQAKVIHHFTVSLKLFQKEITVFFNLVLILIILTQAV